MEALIRIQLAQKEILEKFIANYNKDGKDRRTKNYYEKRLKDLDELWKDFKNRHREILEMKYSEKEQTKIKFDYLESDVFSTVEEFYFSNYTNIKDRYDKEFTANKAKTVETIQEKGTTVEESHGHSSPIKLPKISLDKFYGDYRKWPTFHDLFKSLVHENLSLSSVQKLQYLKLHLGGEPEHLLRHIQVTEGNYIAAWKLLTDRYDNKRVLVNANLKVLFSQASVPSESAQSIKSLLDTTTECIQALRNLGIDTTSWDPPIVYLIVQRLPQETHQLWEQEVSKLKELPSWNQLREFLESRFRTLEAVSSRKQSACKDYKNQLQKSKSTHAFHVTSHAVCPLCAGSHNIRQCPQFLSVIPLKRLEIVKARGLCINCLGSGHMLAGCPSQQRCQHCRQRHHSLLHRNSEETVVRNNNTNTNEKHPNRNQGNSLSLIHATQINPSVNLSQASTSQTLSTTAPEFLPNKNPSTTANLSSFLVNKYPKEQVLLATALIKIVSPLGNEQIVRALIDQGSQASFITESVVQQLKLKKESINASIHSIGQNEVNRISHRVDFIIKSLNTNTEIAVSGLVMQKLTHLLPTKRIVNRNWAHIEGLELADPQFFNPGKIDVLLGADVYSSIIVDGLIKGSKGTPVAQNTTLGWILSGEISEIRENSIGIANFHVCTDLDKQLKLFWELEEIQNEKIYNDEEKLSENLFLSTHKRLENGQYQVDLPFKEETGNNYLGESRSIAIQRLHQMERRFQRDSRMKDEYIKCLREYESLGHMVKTPTTDKDYIKLLEGTQAYTCSYLPHHAVIKESSTTTKMRVVFDASRATKSGFSLNDRLLKGPIVQDELASLLIRWRKHRIAFTADIEKMYRQILVNPDHTEYQRIVWRESTKDPEIDYKLRTVTFGTKSAPYLATRVLRQLALDEKTNYPMGSKITLSDFYVDDLLSGADTVELALKSQKELIDLMKAGGFSLRKWTSNSDKLLETIPEEYRETNLPVNVNGEETVRALGIFWNPQTDSFVYSINFDKQPSKWTKRTILSEVSRLFDPLGWLAPCIILAKILIQNLWLAGSGWDDEISSDLKTQWITYREKMKDITNIQIPRWINFSENDSSIELHIFADASIKAYAAVVYMCTTNEIGERHVSLVSSKTKVAPIKTISLPRLELCAAVLASKLLQYVRNALNISKEISIYAWTDSQIVIAWLRSNPSRWTTFVANRVSHIHTLIGQNIWSHVPSKENPADCISRGMYPAELKNHWLWWNGPNWLWKSREHWPKHRETIETDLEQRKIVVHHVNTASEDLEVKYSSLTKLLRVTAYCKRFIHNMKTSPEKREKSYLKAEEIRAALIFWIKCTQQRYFSDEFKSLQCKKPIDRRSRIWKLSPYLDSNNVIRVSGRLRHSKLTYDEQHPIILPDKGHLTKLIIEKTHKDTLHGGPQLMMTVLAKSYWLVNARNTIRHHIHRCIPCFRQKANTQTQLMGDLPMPRVQVTRPFAHTGVDYCGPYNIKTHKGRNSKTYKAYIALFVCMSTKAIHLELVTDLSAEGFIAAFRRFCSRRGMCSQLYCDCGSNFIGANRLLMAQKKQMIEQINVDMATILENEGVKFNFIPPGSPHFGGLWEAGVRSTKHHLKRVLGNTMLTYEEFNTVLVQIEACLNSRPLCELSCDPSDLEPLTPAHFLIGDILLTPPETSVLDINVNRLNRWQFLQRVYQAFWKRWNAEYLCRLQQRPKWAGRTENVQVGDLVIVKEENVPPCCWIMARIIQTHPGSDGLVRVVTLKTKNSTLKRPITKICLLPITTNNRETNE